MMSYTELSIKKVKCRKPHKCEWCGEEIEKNNNAIYRCYIFDGDFRYAYQHPECFCAMEESYNDFGCDGFETGAQQRGKHFLQEDSK